MTAVALWYVLCYASDDPASLEYQRAEQCWWKTEDYDSQGEAQRTARKSGWLVGRTRSDDNLCPECRELNGV